MTIHFRADRAVFRFSGPDAYRLTRDVLTGAIPAGPQDHTAWWALLTPQGKIMAEGVAGWFEEALWLDTDQSVADDFFKRMKMYRLRAQVMIEDLRESHRVGYTNTPIASGLCHKDQRGAVQLGWRIVAPVAESADWLTVDTAFTTLRIAAGILQLGPDFLAGDAFAHDIGLDLLDGIDFTKGCYVGQEVVSRMKHRGTARRRPVIISGVNAATGTPVIASGREAGVIGKAVDGKAVAILRLDRIVAPENITVDGKAVTVTLPAWASYAFGESSRPE